MTFQDGALPADRGAFLGGGGTHSAGLREEEQGGKESTEFPLSPARPDAAAAGGLQSAGEPHGLFQAAGLPPAARDSETEVPRAASFCSAAQEFRGRLKGSEAAERGNPEEHRPAHRLCGKGPRPQSQLLGLLLSSTENRNIRQAITRDPLFSFLAILAPLPFLSRKLSE